MPSLVKSIKSSRKTRKNKSRKTIGGSPKITAQSVKKADQKLKGLVSAGPPANITSGLLSSTMPTAIVAAKKAITYANAHPGNDLAIRDADIKVELADYWTDSTNSRKNWRNEKNLQPNRSARNWYEPGPNEIWKINTKEKEAKNQALGHMKKVVAALPVDDEHSEMGKEYREAKERFEKI